MEYAIYILVFTAVVGVGYITNLRKRLTSVRTALTSAEAQMLYWKEAHEQAKKKISMEWNTERDAELVKLRRSEEQARKDFFRVERALEDERRTVADLRKELLHVNSQLTTANKDTERLAERINRGPNRFYPGIIRSDSGIHQELENAQLRVRELERTLNEEKNKPVPGVPPVIINDDSDFLPFVQDSMERITDLRQQLDVAEDVIERAWKQVSSYPGETLYDKIGSALGRLTEKDITLVAVRRERSAFEKSRMFWKNLAEHRRGQMKWAEEQFTAIWCYDIMPGTEWTMASAALSEIKRLSCEGKEKMRGHRTEASAEKDLRLNEGGKDSGMGDSGGFVQPPDAPRAS